MIANKRRSRFNIDSSDGLIFETKDVKKSELNMLNDAYEKNLITFELFLDAKQKILENLDKKY